MSSVVPRGDAASLVRPPGWAGVSTCALAGSGSPTGTTGNGTGPVPRHWRPSFHILLLATGGHGLVEVDFRVHPSRPGTLIWIRPGQALRTGRDGLDAACVTFDPRIAAPEPADHVTAGHWQLSGEDEDAVISEFTQLAVDCERLPPGPLTAELLRHELAVLLFRVALLNRPAGGDDGGAEARTFARFRNSLERGHPHSRRVEDYAEELGCSVRTLTRACLAVTGRSAKQVVDDRVSLEARRLLACTAMSVAEVGRHLGFPEPTNFGRFFHREVGLSPGQFRAEMLTGPSTTVPAQRRPTD